MTAAAAVFTVSDLERQLPADHGLGRTVPDTPVWRCLADHIERDPERYRAVQGFVLEDLDAPGPSSFRLRVAYASYDFSMVDGTWLHSRARFIFGREELAIDADCL